MFDQFQETCQEHGIESGKSLAQLKEKWKSLFDKYKTINDNDKATGRGRLTFEFFEEMDSFLGFSDKVNPKFVSETVISNEKQMKSHPRAADQLRRISVLMTALTTIPDQLMQQLVKKKQQLLKKKERQKKNIQKVLGHLKRKRTSEEKATNMKAC